MGFVGRDLCPRKKVGEKKSSMKKHREDLWPQNPTFDGLAMRLWVLRFYLPIAWNSSLNESLNQP